MNDRLIKTTIVRWPFAALLFLGVIYVMLAILLGSSFWWPIKKQAERQKTYAMAYARIDKAGGWQLIEKSCLALSTNADNGVFVWRGVSGSLPQTLAVLQPHEIYMTPNLAGIPIMRIQLFGVHRTGYYDAPYFGIWVVCTNVSKNYIPPIDIQAHGMAGQIERRGDLIFEVR